MIQIAFTPIGFIHTPHVDKSSTPIQPVFAGNKTGTIEIHPEYTEGLKDLEGFSHIILLYVFDRSHDFTMLVKPYLDTKLRGVFATRAPNRPNPIGLSVVRLDSVNGNKITFTGADMLDQTPLLDIKPYIPAFDLHTEVRIGWLKGKMNSE